MPNDHEPHIILTLLNICKHERGGSWCTGWGKTFNEWSWPIGNFDGKNFDVLVIGFIGETL